MFPHEAGRCTHTAAFCERARQLGQPREGKRKEKGCNFKTTNDYLTVIQSLRRWLLFVIPSYKVIHKTLVLVKEFCSKQKKIY